MSLLKWGSALAGTTMGLRYMSDRHRKRIAGGSENAHFRNPRTDRDCATARPGAQGGGSASGMGRAGSGSSGDTSSDHTSSGMPGATAGTGTAGSDDLQAPSSSLSPSGHDNRR